MRSGWFAIRTPISTWDRIQLREQLRNSLTASEYRELLRSSKRFLISVDQRSAFHRLLQSFDEQTAAVHRDSIADADDICEGRIQFFNRNAVCLGVPPNWHRNPTSDTPADRNRHWSSIDDFSSGDIKLVWEASRFSWVFTLVRAYWRTQDEKYVRAFWQYTEDWLQTNPPNQGTHWKCGQEIGMRTFAWCFGLFGFLDHPATSSERVERLVCAMVANARRIEANISYALSQNNNHGLSEAAALFTVGTVFPELRDADRWRSKGRALFEDQVDKLFYEDGVFSQYSLNYQRLALQLCLWFLRLADVNQVSISAKVSETVGRSAEFLFNLTDETTGDVPCYGNNDGALLLPLNNCSARDYRPIVQSSLAITQQTRRFESGPWDEDLLWLLGPTALQLPSEKRPRQTYVSSSGYCVLQTSEAMAFCPCCRFQHRPGHADLLHLDLWWRGQNIAIDPGTYSYNSQAPWNHPFSSTAYHNTVTVDGHDQMTRAGRFLWLPWIRTRCGDCRISEQGKLQYWQGQHDGFADNDLKVSYRRGILTVGESYWIVIDQLDGPRPVAYRLHWLLADFPHRFANPGTDDQGNCRLSLETPEGKMDVAVSALAGESPHSQLVRADPESPRGWRSQYYGDREPALSLTSTVRAKRASFVTVFGPSGYDVSCEELTIRLRAPGIVSCVVSGTPRDPFIVTRAQVGDTTTEDLLVMA